MANQIRISIGQHSDRGCKHSNQDFHGACIPEEPLLSSKGIAIAVADGISSSDVSQIASQTAVTSFLEDYYCTSEAWSVRTSGERVLNATNAWLYSQTRQGHGRYDRDRGYVCTFSAMVIKSTTAHIFHAGDTRIYRLHDNGLEQLTTDHRLSVSREQSYLSRALGIDRHLDIDYRSIQVEQGDIFLLATDGVYEYATAAVLNGAINDCAGDLDKAARAIAELAFRQGSNDNLTIQIVRIDKLPSPEASEMYRQLSALPFPPILAARAEFDGYRIIRELHASSRSHLYLAADSESGATVVIKTPSIDLREDPSYIERFLMEEWVARRINHAHVLKHCLLSRRRGFLYLVTEFIDGKTLAQWMSDCTRPDLDAVRRIIDQVARGLRAFHRLEMLHQDVRPENIMMDSTGTVTIIDFGSTRVAGIMESARPNRLHCVPGAIQYAAPEYFIGEEGTPRSDIYSLGMITYQMLTGRLPYGSEVPKCKSRAEQGRLAYIPARIYDRNIPRWVDEAIRKAVHPDPIRRYDEASEFVYDLYHPNKAFLSRAQPPLAERNPVVFWQSLTLILSAMVVMLLYFQTAGG